MPGPALGPEAAGGALQGRAHALGDASQTTVLLVTRPERGAIAEDAALADELAAAGHSMLLRDATGAYHRQMTREFEGPGAARMVTPLMRPKDGATTKIILVTLPWLATPPVGVAELSRVARA